MLECWRVFCQFFKIFKEYLQLRSSTRKNNCLIGKMLIFLFNIKKNKILKNKNNLISSLLSLLLLLLVFGHPFDRQTRIGANFNIGRVCLAHHLFDVAHQVLGIVNKHFVRLGCFIIRYVACVYEK